MPSYADIGKITKDLLLGNPKSGAYSYDPKLTFASSTSNGVTYAVTAVKKADKVDGTLKISYATKKYGADATVDPSGKVSVAASLSDVIPSVKGVKLTANAVLPDPTSAKVTIDYAPCKEFASKTTVALTSAPTVDFSAACDYKNVLVGGEVAYDTSKSAVTKYNVAVGYHAGDSQVAVFLTDKASVAKIAYAHTVSSSTTLGAEVSRKIEGGETTFTLGYAKKLTSGALAKLKLDNAGTLSALYETKLASGEKVASSLQLATTDLSKPVKYGFSLDLS